MNINILTFHSELNFGANLQAYALKEFLTSNGHNVSFIDYNRVSTNNKGLSFIRSWIGKTPSATFLKVKNNIVGPKSIKSNSKREKIFDEFQQKYLLKTTKIFNSLDMLKESAPEADVYIVGSDQIWSHKIVSYIDFPIYFLNFGSKNILRISYAASSGGETFPEDVEILAKQYITKFNNVGVREQSLESYLHKIGINKAKWTPDPTFLINWREHLKINNLVRLDRIAQFTLANNNIEKANKLEKEIRSKQLDFHTLLLSEKIISPFDWVLEISKSKILITDSYHAVLFAIYTNTPFLFIKWGGEHKRDARVLELLKLFKIEHLAIEEPILNNEIEILFSKIDWSHINNKIFDFRKLGEEFLVNSLKNK